MQLTHGLLFFSFHYDGGMMKLNIYTRKEIRDMRKRLNMTQSQLAEVCHITRQTLAAIETDRVKSGHSIALVSLFIDSLWNEKTSEKMNGYTIDITHDDIEVIRELLSIEYLIDGGVVAGSLLNPSRSKQRIKTLEKIEAFMYKLAYLKGQNNERINED